LARRPEASYCTERQRGGARMGKRVWRELLAMAFVEKRKREVMLNE
jgi:hypothetical protein